MRLVCKHGQGAERRREPGREGGCGCFVGGWVRGEEDGGGQRQWEACDRFSLTFISGRREGGVEIAVDRWFNFSSNRTLPKAENRHEWQVVRLCINASPP